VAEVGGCGGRGGGEATVGGDAEGEVGGERGGGDREGGRGVDGDERMCRGGVGWACGYAEVVGRMWVRHGGIDALER